jgi:hypothetical protein
MTSTATVTETGRLIVRGDVAANGRNLIFARPETDVIKLAIDYTSWLGSATITDRKVMSYGPTVTDDGASGAIWSLRLKNEGAAGLQMTSSDNRVMTINAVVNVTDIAGL